MITPEQYDKFLNLLKLGKGILGISKNKITEISLWLKEIETFMEKFNNHFKFENTTIDDMIYILEKHRDYIFNEIINK